MFVLAQDGSRPGTKITNGYQNGEIKGAILSVMSRRPENLINCVETIQNDTPDMLLIIDTHSHSSVFPNTDKHGYIPDYGLFDMNVSAFELQSNGKIDELVEGTLDFQNNLGVKVLTSAALTMQEFNDANAQVSLDLYRKSVQYMRANRTPDRKLYATLVFSEQALNQTTAMAQLLDRLCLIDVDGFYIIVQRQKDDLGMWSSADTLASLMYLVNTLHENQYEVIVGYTDFYGILLAAVGADYVASGWFQTLRQYSQAFYRNSRGGPGSPLYLSESLLSSIYTNPDLRNIVNNSQCFGPRVIDTKYGGNLLKNPGRASWSDEAYALQHWHATKNIVSRFGQNIDDNLSTVESLIDSAKSLMKEIRSARIAIDDRHDERHLTVWKSAIEKYKSGVL